MLRSDRDTIGQAVGRLPSGCAILTASHAGNSTGVLVSWIQQAAFEPLMVTVAIKRGRPVQELLEAAGRFALNLIGDDPKPLFRHFGRGFAIGEDAFAGLETHRSEYGLLLKTAIAHLGCEVRTRVPAGDHDLYLVEVVAANVSADANPYVHSRSTGLSY